jgi:hypothetical protein
MLVTFNYLALLVNTKEIMDHTSLQIIYSCIGFYSLIHILIRYSSSELCWLSIITHSCVLLVLRYWMTASCGDDLIRCLLERAHLLYQLEKFNLLG